MELQELTLQSVVSQFRPTHPSLEFVDHRGKIIADLGEEFELPDWGYGNDFAELFNANRATALHVASNDVRVMVEHVTDRETVKDLTKRASESILDKLKVDEIQFVGVRTWWTAAASEFDELNSWMVQTFSSGFTGLFEDIGKRPSDSGWVFEFRDEDPKVTVRIGPMTAEQAVEQVFRDDDAGNFPPNFLYLDLDRVFNEEAALSRDSALEKWEQSFDRQLALGDRLGDRIGNLT